MWVIDKVAEKCSTVHNDEKLKEDKCLGDVGENQALQHEESVKVQA